MGKKVLGYACVSSYEQNADRQVTALREIPPTPGS